MSDRLGPVSVLLEQQVVGQLVARGGRVVYTLRVSDADSEVAASRSELWTFDDLDSTPRRLTTRTGDHHGPKLHHSRRLVACIYDCGDEPSSVLVIDLNTGELTDLGGFHAGVQEVEWLRDELVVVAEDENCPQRLDAADGSVVAVLPDRLTWRADGEKDGVRLAARHLHRLTLTGDHTRLTQGDWSAQRPRVGPDGQVYFLADAAPDDRNQVMPHRQVYRIDPRRSSAESTPLAVTSMEGGVHRFHVLSGADGITVRVLGHLRANPVDHDAARIYDIHLQAADARGSDPVLRATPEGWLGLLGDETDVHDWALELDDAATMSSCAHDGSNRPIDVDTGESLVDGPVITGALAEDDISGSRYAVLAVGPGPSAPEVYRLEHGRSKRMTDHGSWLDPAATGRWERRTVVGPGGPITVHLLHPRDRGLGPHPAVVAIHGGPTSQWGVVPTLEAYVLSAAGYLVVMPNIRGSVDQGSEWVEALSGRWGDVDAADVNCVCDALTADGTVDPERLAISGLSYGGFLVNWLIGITDRFAAAISENGVTNQVWAWTGSDLGLAYNRAAGLGDPLDPAGAERLWNCSPLRNVAAVRTPLLMFQGGDDRVCPAADNEQFFVALRSLGRPVEYVLYPQEGHLMQATGRLDRRIDRQRRALAFLDRHIGERG